MKVLVTGGAGFIGSHVCDGFLADGHEVSVIDDLSRGRAGRLPETVELHRVSVLDAPRLAEVVAAIEPELICHLAAQVDVRESVADPRNDADVNVIGTVNVLEAARVVGARVLFASTGGAIYGEDAPVPSPETALSAPGSPYGVAKYCAEQYLGLYNRLFGTEHAVLRFANVYGPRQPAYGEAAVIPVFCSNGIQGKPLTIYGDGKQTRDFVYVGDVVAAFMAASAYGKAGVWNIGTGIELNVLELAEGVVRLTGGRSELVFAPPRAGELARSALACERAAQDLGWRPAMSLADGLQTVVSWFESGAPDRASR